MWTDPTQPADPYMPGHGDDRYAVQAYDLDLDYAIASNHLSGRATLRCRILEATASIDLDLAGTLRVMSVTCAGASLRRHTHRGQRLTLRFTKELPAGAEITVTVATRGTPRPLAGIGGTAGWEELDDGVIVASQPHGAPSWFPCNDRASDKASYRLTITCDAAYTVIANGALTRRRKAGRKTVWTYEQPEPMAPYLATVQIGRYETREVTGAPVPVRIVGPARLRRAIDEAFADQAAMVAAMVDWFGPYPFAAGYAAVVTDDDLEIPLESQTLATFGANLTHRGWEAQRLIAHELAHQWWGNAVTARQWSDIWIHEGFACYTEWLWSPLAGGRSTEEWARHHWARLTELPHDLIVGAPGAADMFDDRVYKRGALTVHAVRVAVGEEAFWALVRSFVAEHRYAVVSTADFEAHASRVAGVDLSGLFDAWLRSPALPPFPSPATSLIRGKNAGESVR